MSAAEVSADLLAGNLAEELKGCKLFGMGGEKMRRAGVDVRLDITGKSSIGIIEALKYLPHHLLILKKLKEMLKKERPDALILIDAQGLNMVLASYARKLGIKTIYYIAPQEWLWGTKRGVEKVAKTIGLIVSIFKKEHETFKAAGGNSVFFGHPLLDVVKTSMNRDEFCRKFGFNKDQKLIALCPGSRYHEIKDLLPILIETASKIKGAQFVMPISSPKFRQSIEEKVVKASLNIKIIEGFNYDVLGHSDLVISKSGTTILECVCLGTPVIMFYKLSPLTYFIGKHFLGIKLKYYSMPNILTDKMVVPEYVMSAATAENLYKEAVRMLAEPEKARADYAEIRMLLGEPGATVKAAEKILEFVKG